MEYSETMGQATQLAERAFELMKGYGIPPTPRNFTVWFGYAARNYPDLFQAVEALVKTGKPITEQQNTDLYDRFYGRTEEEAALEATTRKVGVEITHVMEMLADVAGGVHSYGESLQTNLGELGQASGLNEITAVVGSLVQATRSMQQRNTELEQRLHLSATEINALKENLEAVQQEAMTDALTGISNRKFFDLTLRTGSVAALEAGEPLCLALTDIDFFKKFNDTYGHQTGDQVLKLVASILRQSIKGRDTAARYGGEEFALILPQTALADARTLCEQVRQTVASKRIRNRQSGEEMGTITLSIGIAEYRPGEPLTELIQRADEGLYLAKRTGRNRVIDETELQKAVTA